MVECLVWIVQALALPQVPSTRNFKKYPFKRGLVQTNVLILADGIVAKHFLQRLAKSYAGQNRYYVVHTDPSIRPKEEKENFLFYQFDPTSFVKLSHLFTRRYNEAIIVLGNKIDTIASYENIRRLDSSLHIVILDKWDLQLEGKNFVLLNANDILAAHVFDHVPNVPVIAQNVGLGKGEIMEVLVPFGSSYVYRHIGSIEQKRWRIAALYRDNELILPEPYHIILPNDLLLLIGDPDVLEQVFKSIKQEVGQFPMPYGRDSYLFIDMAHMDAKSVRHVVLGAIFLHRRLKDRTLFIRVVNPNNIELLDFIKGYDSETIEVLIEYKECDGFKKIDEDLQSHSIGLFMLYKELFRQKTFRKFLHERGLPVISLSHAPFESLKEAALILGPNKDIERISSIVFDIIIQLRLTLKLYQYTQDTHPIHKEIIEHFENLANIFSKPIEVIKTSSNPVRLVANESNMLLIYPFSKKVVNANPLNIFCTDPEALFYKLDRHHQIFIPAL